MNKQSESPLEGRTILGDTLVGESAAPGLQT